MRYMICSRCVMDTSDPDIEFDVKGVCNKCTGFLTELAINGYRNGHSESMWADRVNYIKNSARNSKYDCIVGVSGGVDSSYAAYLCRRYDLRALLFHLDNGWNSELAVSNIKSLAEKLNYDYYCHVINWDEFKEVQKAFLRAFSVDLEMPTDIAIYASICQVAKRFKIKNVIAGGNLATEGMLPAQWGHHKYKDMKMYRHIVRNFSEIKLKETPAIGLMGDIYFRFIYGMRFHYILNHHPYDPGEVRKTLAKEVGWMNYGGKHFESQITAFWQGYVMPEKFKMDYRRPTLSVMICNGTMTRFEALKELEKPQYIKLDVDIAVDYISQKFGIPRAEFLTLLDGRPKTYVDFPNNAAFLRFIYSSYKLLIKPKKMNANTVTTPNV
jgi:N-acetyl sugar amidotransferase